MDEFHKRGEIKHELQKNIVISILLLVLSVAAVSASDLNDNYVTELSYADDSLSIGDSLIESSEIQSSESLSTSAGTFADLQREIDNAPDGSVLNLTRNYNGQEDATVHINKNLIIDGQGHTIDCLQECVAFTSEKGTVTLKNLNIINGYNNNWGGTAYGGALIITGTAQYTIDNCTFKDNYADDRAGAIYHNSNGDLIIKNSIFRNNKADDYYGGAIGVYNGNLTVYNSVFENNHANDNAGAIGFYSKGKIYIIGCSFKSNRVENNALQTYSYGGAIYSMGYNDFYIINSTFSDNYAEDYGGAVFIYFSYGNLYIDVNSSSSSSFINNCADDNSGGAINARCNIFAENTRFSGNYAYVDGGAVYAGEHPQYGDDIEVCVNLKNCLFESNNAKDANSQCYGGAIHVIGDVTADNCTFKDNFARDYGGAIYAKNVYINRNDDIGEFSSFFINNKAGDDKGGAIYADGGSVTIVNTVLSGNTANVDGGAVYADSNVNVKHCSFESNKADGASSQCYGGAIRAVGDVTVGNCTFKDNFAHDYGGAIYAHNVFINSNDDIGEFTSFFINNKVDDDKGGAIY